MSVLASRVPGFHLNPVQSPFAPSHEEAIGRLAGYVGRDCIDRMLESGTLVLIRGFENYPGQVIRAVLRCSPRPSCVFVKDEGAVYVDETCAGRSTFAVEFLLCAGFIAHGLEPIPAALIANNTRYIIEHCIRGKEPKPPFRGFLRYLLRHHAVRLECSGVCAIEEYLIREPKRQLSQYSARIVKKLRSLHGGEPLDVKDLFPLALILTERTSRLTKAGLRQSGLDIFEQEALAAWQAPLGACVSLSTEPLPPPAWFFMPKKFRENDLEAEMPYPAPFDSPDFIKDDWSLDANAIPIYNRNAVMPVSSLDLRPFAYITARSSLRKGQPRTVTLLQTSLEDPLVAEFTPLNCLPSVCPAHKSLVTILSAEVCPTLDWAHLTLSVPSLVKKPIRALCTSWTVQADRLRMQTEYRANLSFWAHAIQKAAPQDRFSPELVPASDWPCTLTRCTVRISDIDRAPSAAGVELVKIRCKAGSNFTRGLLVIAPKVLLESADLHSGEFAELTGIFLVGDLMNHQEALAQTCFKHEVASFEPLPKTAQNRMIRKLAHSGHTEALIWLSRNLEARRPKVVIQAFLRHAANRGNMRAAVALCVMHLRDNLLRRMDEPGWGVVRDYAKYISESDPNPLTDLAYLSPEVKRLLPADYQQHLFEMNTFQKGDQQSCYDYAMKLLEAKSSRSSQSEIVYNQTLAAYLLQNSVARGFLIAGYELAKCYALGIGFAASIPAATAVLIHCCEQQFAPAKYWYAGFAQAGADFFTKPRSWRKKKVLEGVDAGDPTAILRTALFYLFDQQNGEPEQDANLIAYGLLRHLKQTVCDVEACRLLDGLSMRMSDEELEQVQHFDVWKALGIAEPDLKFPIAKFSSELNGPVIMHPPFLRELDPNIDKELSPKMLSQVMFLAENSTPFTFGFAQTHEVERDPGLRLTSLREQSDQQQSVRGSLLISSGRQTAGGPWALGSIYPFFETGIDCVATVQTAFISDKHSSAVLVAGYRTPNDNCEAFSFFEPLWPLMSQTYRIGETYRFKLYGLCDSAHLLIEEGPEFMDPDHPVGPFCEVLGCDIDNAQVRFASEILAITHHVCQIAGVDYAMLLVHPVIHQDIDERPMPVFISENLLSKSRDLKVGVKTIIEAELHGWAIDLAFAPNATTLN